jgi:hypothetical protein
LVEAVRRSGVDLAERFYVAVVSRLVKVPHAAALVGE